MSNRSLNKYPWPCSFGDYEMRLVEARQKEILEHFYRKIPKNQIITECVRYVLDPKYRATISGFKPVGRELNQIKEEFFNGKEGLRAQESIPKEG